jgi:tRNA dimethylallyltransferase
MIDLDDAPPPPAGPASPRLVSDQLVLVVVGPTASGKTALALRLAEALGGEILGCDALQIRAGLPILTAKPTAEEQARARHHLIGVLPASPAASAAQYVALADAALAELARRRTPAVLCGGTGLYLRALCEGLFPGPAADPTLRESLRAEAAEHGWPALHARLADIDPEAAARISPTDPVRIERALEIFAQSRKTQSQWFTEHAAERARGPRYRTLRIALDPGPEVGRSRIAARAEAMFASGVLDEVAAQRAQGALPDAPLGYDLLCQILDGTLSLDEGKVQLAQQTAQYARRQRTWLRKEADLTWYRDAAEVPVDAIAQAVRAATAAA